MYLEKKSEHFDGFEIFGHNGRVPLIDIVVRNRFVIFNNAICFQNYVYLTRAEIETQEMDQ